MTPIIGALQRKLQQRSHWKASHLLDDELAFSNALAFYIEKYPHLFSKTFDLALNKSTDKKIIVEREWNHIDIYVKIGDNKRIIIENKIHSGINCSTKETDENANKRDGEKES